MMHVEIQVAQNFVLNFLYNKLPRRRVNLFGEELEVALRDKFADHWYPDKPFKGSAYRCLKITDPADPVLNRAAKESGNPVSDIVENLPADLAIWIDPGEVSYRIGEKGSVKILYSENDANNYAVQNGLLTTAVAAAAAAAVVTTAPTVATTPPATLTVDKAVAHPPQVASPSNLHGSGLHDDLCQEILGLTMPLDNLNSSLSALSLSNGPAPASNGCLTSNNSSSSNNSNVNGFAPFAPRPHQPVTYTAGTFAQTKFGSTKLKTNGKKTNRMSPTEFSNYIKQRAMQKQNSCPNGSVMNGGGGNGMTIGINGVGRSNAFRNSSGGVPTNGFYNHQQQNLNLTSNGGINCGRMQQQQQQQGSPDPYFYPLFTDRNQGNSGSLNLSPSSSTSSSSSSSCSMLFNGFNAPAPIGSSSLSSSGSSSASSISSNPWSTATFADAADTTESFLQDIFNVGLNGSPKQNNRDNYGFGNNSGGLGFGLCGGQGMGSFGNFGSSNNSGLGNFGSNFFDAMSPTEESHIMGNALNCLGNLGSVGNSVGGSTNNKAVGGPTRGEAQSPSQQQQQQQQQHRVLVAN